MGLMDGVAALPLVVLLVLAPLGAVAVGAAAGDASASQEPNRCVGTVTDPPETATVVSLQGARGGDKTDAMLASFAPSGEVIGVHNAAEHGRWWAYDVDRLPNGNFLVATTQSHHTIVVEIDAETGKHVSLQSFDENPRLHDTHDADLINGEELLMNDMGDERDRVVVYNLTREEVVWEYRFDEHNDHFPRDGGGPYETDWTHNNDVEQIREGVFMVSLKNFDQVVAINRSTKDIEWTLGADDNDAILHEQHNPDYIETEDGRPVVLVADSLNDRVVEYTREDDGWNRTWVLRGGGLDEPRDADRLPNGNTLVSDRRGHRFLEVTPDGEVVWEVYGPWQPYDAERLGTRDESSPRAMADYGTTGVVELESEPVDTTDVEACYEHLLDVERTRLVPEDDPGVKTRSVVDRDGTERDTSNGDGTDDGMNGDGTDSGGSATATRETTETEDGLLGSPAADTGPDATVIGAASVVLLAAVALGVLAWRQRG
jgi:hypothetical protein